MNDDNKITFQEFQELCTETGISTDNLGVMEQDFRAGTALADVTDGLITSQEERTEAFPANEAIDLMDVYLTRLAEAPDKSVARDMAVKLAIQVIRYMAESCHDEGQN